MRLRLPRAFYYRYSPKKNKDQSIKLIIQGYFNES